MSQDPALPKFEVPIADKSGVTTKNWYFFFSQLLNSITGGVTKIIAGTNVTISPTSGVGDVTINATGGGGSGTVTSVATGTGLTGGPITTSGTIALANTAVTPASYTNTNLTVDAQGRITAASNGSAGSGTVTSVALSDASTNPIYTITGSPVTTTGTLTETLKTQTANTVFAGPASGAAAQPGFRTLTSGDIAAASGVPASIPDLTMWLDASRIKGTSGQPVQRIGDATPWIGGLLGVINVADAPVTINGTQLNGLNTLLWASTGAGNYQISSPFQVVPTGSGAVPATLTIFIVMSPGTNVGSQCILGGAASSSLSLYLANGSRVIALVKTSTSVIGTCSTLWTSATPFQANVTYNGTTGAFAFRQASTAVNSGTGATNAGITALGFIGADVGPTNSLSLAAIAEIIVYNRILSGTEITNVENYLLAKWGV